MAYLLDYDLYLIRKYLKTGDVLNVVPIPANAPEHFRIYFSVKGEIPFGLENPSAKEMLFLKSLAYTCKDKGDCFVFVIRQAHIVEVLTLDSWGLLYALTTFVSQNVLRPLFEQTLRQTMSHWRSPEILGKNGAEHLLNASDEDILQFLYKDKP